MSATVALPMYFLKSFAYSGVAFVATLSIGRDCAAGPKAGRIGDALDVRWLVCRVLLWYQGRLESVHKPVEQMFWYRSSKLVMRR